MAPLPTASASHPNPQTGPARTNKLMPLVPVIAAGIVGFLVGLANGIAGMLCSIAVGVALSVFYIKRMSVQQALDALQKKITTVPFIMQIVYMIGTIVFFSIFSVVITKGGLWLPDGVHNPNTLVKYLSIIWVLPENFSKAPTHAFPGYPGLIILATIIMLVGTIIPERFLNKKIKPIIMLVGIIILTAAPTITHSMLGQKGAVPWDYLPVFYLAWVGLIMVMVAVYLPWVLEKMGLSGKGKVPLAAGLMIPFMIPLLPPLFFITGSFEGDHHDAAMVISGWVAALIGMHNASLAGKTTHTPPAKAPVPATPPEEPDTPPEEPDTPPEEPDTPPEEPDTPPEEPDTPPEEPDTPPEEPDTPPEEPDTPPEEPDTPPEEPDTPPEVPDTPPDVPVTPATGPVASTGTTIDPNATPATNLDEGIGGGTTASGFKDGEVKSYKNPLGWGDDIELTYDAGKDLWHNTNDNTWYNSLENFKKYQQTSKDNEDWNKNEFDKTSSGHDGFDNYLHDIAKKKMDDFNQKMKDDHDKQKKKDDYAEIVNKAHMDTWKANQTDKHYGWLETGASFVEGSADFGVNVLEKMTGTPGKYIKMGYIAGKNIGKNLSETWDGGWTVKSFSKGLSKGITEGVVDVGINEVKGKLTDMAGNKIPGLYKYPGADVHTWSKIDPKTLSGYIAKQQIIDKGIKDGVKSAIQSAIVGKVQTPFVNDPIKAALKLK